MGSTGALLVILALLGACGGGSDAPAAAPEGEVTPPRPAPGRTWVEVAGGRGACWSAAVAVGADGTAAAVGGLDDTATFGSGQSQAQTLSAVGSLDGFLATYGPEGGLRWVTALEGGLVVAQDVAVAHDGSLYVAGFFFDTVTLDREGAGATTLAVSPADAADGYEDGFLARYAPDGTLTWVRHLAADYETEVLGVVARGNGSVAVCGLYGAEMVLGAGEANETLLVPGGFLEGFLAAYDAEGSLLWAETTVSARDAVTTMWCIAADEHGAIVVGGEYDVAATIGTQPLVASAGSQDVHLSRWQPNGSFAWACAIGGPDTDQVFGVSLAPDGTIRIAGSFQQTSQFGFVQEQPLVLTARGGADGYVASYTAVGDVLWAEQIGGPGTDHANDMWVDSAGDTHVIGAFQGEAVIGAGQPGETTLQSPGTGDTDAFVAEFDALGELGRARRLGGVDKDYGQGIGGYANGDLILTGSFEGDATLADDPAVLPGIGDRAAFVVRTTTEKP